MFYIYILELFATAISNSYKLKPWTWGLE